MISNLAQPILFYGVVEDREDPLKLGRCRIRIAGIHTNDKIILPTEHLDWSLPAMPISSASMNGVGQTPLGVVEGSWVIGFSRDEIYQNTVYFASLGGIPDTLSTAQGFQDPNQAYPRVEYLNQPDTNKLARNEEIQDTVVKTKLDEAIKKTYSYSRPFDEPDTPYDAVYPHNHVRETESGHIIELDDTDAKERVHLFHRSGTFFEIYPSGKLVVKNVEEKFELTLSNNHVLIKGSDYVRVNGSREVRIDRNHNVFISGSQNIKVLGNARLDVDGDCSTFVTGNHNMDVSTDFNLKVAGNMSVDVGANYSLKVGGSSNIDITADQVYSIGAASTWDVFAESTFTSQRDTIISANGSVNMFAGFNMDIASNIATSLYSGGSMACYGVGSADLGSAAACKIGGVSIDLDTCTPGSIAAQTPPTNNPETPEEPAPAEFITIEDEQNALDDLSDEEYPHGFDETSYPLESLAKRGITDTTATTEETEETESPVEEEIVPESDWDSRHFTLEQVSSAAVVSHYQLRDQHGLTKEEIQSNLNYLCVNVLDRIKDAFPAMFVTSGFRAASTNSKHEYGIAADIQVAGYSNKDYYEMALAIANGGETDALLVEYKNYGTKLGWIHVGYNKKGNRGIKATYYNNRKHSNGLAYIGETA